MNCRLCGGTLRLVLDLGHVPPANRYRRGNELALAEPVYPLRFATCETCTHAQLMDQQPSGLFTNRPYLYRSGTSASWHAHCRGLAATIGEGRGRLALDIGSNDGTMLTYLDAVGYTAVGVEPSVELNASHRFDAIPTFWTPAVARDVVKTQGRAKVITAMNVLAHVENVGEFLDACAIALAPDGVLIVECPDLCAMAVGADFGAIYHEHVHYWTTNTLQWFAETHGLNLQAVEHLSVHCGSIRLRFGFEATKIFCGAAVDFDAFASRVAESRANWTTRLSGWRDAGEIVAGYGASAKGMTLLTTTPVPEAVNWIVDDNPGKQGWFTPGEPIPILPPDALGAPDRVVLLAWNLAEEMTKKLRSLGYTGPVEIP